MSDLPSRRDVLIRGSAAAAAGLLAGRAAAVPPPQASKCTSVVLLSAADLKPVHTLVEATTEFRGHDDAKCPAFSPDGKLAACVAGPKWAGVWDVATGRQAADLGHASALAFRPTGEVVTASAGNYDGPGLTGLCREWAAGRKEAVKLFGHRLEKPILSPDGRFLAGWATKDLKTDVTPRDALRVLSVPGGEERAADVRASSFSSVLLAALPGGDRVVIGTWPKNHGDPMPVWVWSMKDGKRVGEVTGRPPVAASADGKRLALRGSDPAEVLLWDPDAGTKTVLRHGHAELSAVGFSADGKRLATAGPKVAPARSGYQFLVDELVPQVVTAWDLATAKTVVSAGVGDVRFQWLAFSPDGKHLLAAGSEMVYGEPTPRRAKR
jgi:WD40 repeat protein